MALIVRTDLDMSRGKIVAQAAHAAVEVALKARGTAMFERWRQAGSRKISLIASDLETLDHISSKVAHGIVCHMVKDAGHTEVPPGTYTVLGLLGPRNSIEILTENLSLL